MGRAAGHGVMLECGEPILPPWGASPGTGGMSDVEGLAAPEPFAGYRLSSSTLKGADAMAGGGRAGGLWGRVKNAATEIHGSGYRLDKYSVFI